MTYRALRAGLALLIAAPALGGCFESLGRKPEPVKSDPLSPDAAPSKPVEEETLAPPAG